MSEGGELMSLADLIRILRRRLGIVIVTAAIVLVLGVGLVLSRPALAEARAGLALQRSSPLSFDATGDQTQAWEMWANTQREQLLSRRVLERVLSSGILLGNPTYAGAQDPISTLAKRITATTNRQSWYVAVSLRDEDPTRAELALQALIDAFLEEQDALRAARSNRTLATLTAKHAEAELEVRTFHDGERVLREEHNLMIADPDRNPLALRLVSLMEHQNQFEGRRIAQRTLVDLVAVAQATLDAAHRREALLRMDAIARAPAVSQILAAWRTLRVEEAALAEKYGDRHPRMVEMRQQLENRGQQIDQAIDQTAEALSSELEALDRQHAAMQDEITQTSTDLQAYRNGLDRLRLLTQQTAAAEKVLGDLALRLSQEKAQSALVFSETLQPVDPPRAAWDTSDPRRPALLLAVGLASLAGGLLTALFWDLARGRNLTVQAISRALQRPVFAEIPLPPGTAIFAAAGEPEALMEAFRMARQGLLPSLSTTQGTVIVMLSVNRRENTTLCAARLAQTFAAAGARTLLIDGDLRARSLSEIAHHAADLGLSDLLSGADGIAAHRMPGEDDLSLMPAGALSNSPGDLIHSHCLQEWLAQVRQNYAVIIIDSPALADYSDAHVLTGSADAGVFVIDATLTSNAELEVAHSRLGPIRQRVVGAIGTTRGLAAGGRAGS